MDLPIVASLTWVIRITDDEAVDQLLSDDPLALLIAMVLDQQIPLERAFRSPFDLKERLGGRSMPPQLASMDPDALAAVFSEQAGTAPVPPVDGRPGAGGLLRWSSSPTAATPPPSGPRPRTARSCWPTSRRCPGFGEQKARIFVALLGKQLGVRPPGWEKAAAPYGETGSFRSVADIDSPEALAKVRQYKQKMKAEAKAKAPNAGLSARWLLPTGGASADRRLYLCTPDRPDLERFVDACIEGGVDIVQLREKHLADRHAGRAGRAGAAGLRRPPGAVHPQRPPRPGRRHRRRRRPRRPGRLSPVEARRLVGDEAVDRPVDPRAARAGRSHRRPGPRWAGPGPSTPSIHTSRPARWSRPRPSPAGPVPGSATSARPWSRSPWPVWVTGGVDPDTVGRWSTAGARHFVVVRWLTEADDPGRRARELRAAIDERLIPTSTGGHQRPPSAGASRPARLRLAGR